MFTVGEFSKLTRVSKRMLRYYDELDLFKPAQTHPTTGRRYYSSSQMPVLNRILALKDLGLTLKQVGHMLQDDVSDAEIRGMFMIKKAEIEQTVLDDLDRLRRIEARLQQNQMVNTGLDVVIKSIPAQPILSIRTHFSSGEALMQMIEGILQTVPSQVPSGALGAFVGVFYADDFTLTENDVDLGYFLNKSVSSPIQLGSDCVLEMSELEPVVTMATCVQRGGADPALFGFGKIAQWIESNGYRIAGPYREIGHNVTSLADFDDVTLEIQMPIEKANSL